MKKKEKYCEEEETIVENSRGLSEPPNLDSLNEEFENINQNGSQRNVLSVDLSDDPNFQ